VVKNEVFLCGSIASINGKEGSGRLVLACPMIRTERDRETGTVVSSVRTNFPALSFGRSTATKDILKTFKKGDRVEVRGHLGSYLELNENWERTEVMNLYLDEITHEKNPADVFGLGEAAASRTSRRRAAQEIRNEVYLTGKLAGIAQRGSRVLTLRLDVSERGRKNFLNAVYFGTVGDVAKGLSIGDEVHVFGQLQTRDDNERRPTERPDSKPVAVKEDRAEEGRAMVFSGRINGVRKKRRPPELVILDIFPAVPVINSKANKDTDSVKTGSEKRATAQPSSSVPQMPSRLHVQGAQTSKNKDVVISDDEGVVVLFPTGDQASLPESGTQGVVELDEPIDDKPVILIDSAQTPAVVDKPQTTPGDDEDADDLVAGNPVVR